MKSTIALIATAQAYNLSNQEKLHQITQVYDDVDNSFVQLEESKILETTIPEWKGWVPKADGFPGTVNEYGNFMDPYSRVIPERFVGDAAMEDTPPVDKFTQNLMNKYATEGFTDKKHPKPSGKFYINKDNGLKVAKEVACTHFKLCGAEGDAWLTSPDMTRYENAFKYYDVNNEGHLDAVGVSQMFRHLFMPLGWIDL